MLSISASKTIWDMIFGAINSFNATNKAFFADHVEHLYTEVCAINQDYVAGFREAREIIDAGTQPPVAILSFLRDRRTDYLNNRDAMKALSEELAKHRRRHVSNEIWEVFEEFCNACASTLSSGEGGAPLSWYSDLINIVETRVQMDVFEASHWSPLAISGNCRVALLREIDRSLQAGLPNAMKQVNKTYGTLRARLL